MLGMYIHTHWGYNHPYAARTWTLADWEGYLGGLAALGYDFIMIWPLLDSMPPVPNASDRAFLEMIAHAIDLAQVRFGMRVAVIACPNTIGNDAASRYTFQERPYFTCEQKVDPRDKAAVAAFLQGRRNQLALLAKADALAIIDSDPGGYAGSTNDEFVDLVRGQIDIFRALNPQAELIYWMLFGWENYNRFWAAVQTWNPGDPAPGIDVRPDVFVETLALIRERIPEPWSLFACRQEHENAISSLDLQEKSVGFPYGLVEGEPTFPLTNWEVDRLEEGLASRLVRLSRRGVMANAQTHCLQLPHIYLFAHLARGGTRDTVNLAAFGERLIPGAGAAIAHAWSALASEAPERQRDAAHGLREEARRSHGRGKLAGLLFGDQDRFMIDLAMNLDARARLVDFDAAVQSGQGVVPALRRLLERLRPYQRRIGFVDAYGGPLEARLNRPLARLGEPLIDEVLNQFHDWRNPSVRNGLLERLLSALEAFCREKGH
jgi:hypothetical protein